MKRPLCGLAGRDRHGGDDVAGAGSATTPDRAPRRSAGSDPLSRSAVREPVQPRGLVGGAVLDQRDLLRSPGTAGSASRAITSVSASAAAAADRRAPEERCRDTRPTAAATSDRRRGRRRCRRTAPAQARTPPRSWRRRAGERGDAPASSFGKDRADQPSIAASANSDCCESCQPVGLGPCTKRQRHRPGLAVGQRRGDVGGRDVAVLVDVGDRRGQREVALRTASVVLGSTP